MIESTTGHNREIAGPQSQPISDSTDSELPLDDVDQAIMGDGKLNGPTAPAAPDLHPRILDLGDGPKAKGPDKPVSTLVDADAG
jgi:hypothetical protein